MYIYGKNVAKEKLSTNDKITKAKDRMIKIKNERMIIKCQKQNIIEYY